MNPFPGMFQFICYRILLLFNLFIHWKISILLLYVVPNFNTEVKTDKMLVDKWDSARSGRTEL